MINCLNESLMQLTILCQFLSHRMQYIRGKFQNLLIYSLGWLSKRKSGGLSSFKHFVQLCLIDFATSVGGRSILSYIILRATASKICHSSFYESSLKVAGVSG